MENSKSHTPQLAAQLARLWPSNTLLNSENCKNLDALPAAVSLWLHARTHGTAPIIYDNLKKHQLLHHFPTTIAEKFRRAYYHTLTHNLKHRQVLSELAPIFTDHPAIILKGLVLVSQIYKNPALRPVADIDLLVHASDTEKIKQRLYALDFRPALAYSDIYVRDTLQIDLHVHPFNTDRIAARHRATPLNLDLLWETASPFAEIPPFKKLDLPHQILTLSVHALKHGYERDIWLIDLLGSLKQASSPEQWEEVKICNQNAHALGILAYGIHAIAHRLKDELPPSVEELQKSFPIGPIRRKILKISDPSGEFQILEPLILLQSISGITNKFRCLTELIFPKRPVLAQISGQSGRWAFYLSYPCRILQLIARGTIQVCRLLGQLFFTNTH